MRKIDNVPLRSLQPPMEFGGGESFSQSCPVSAGKHTKRRRSMGLDLGSTAPPRCLCVLGQGRVLSALTYSATILLAKDISCSAGPAGVQSVQPQACSCKCTNYASPHMRKSNGQPKRQNQRQEKDIIVCSFVSRNKTKAKCLAHKMRNASKLSRDLPWKRWIRRHCWYVV